MGQLGDIFLFKILREVDLVHEAYQAETEAPRPEVFANRSEALEGVEAASIPRLRDQGHIPAI